MTTWSLEQISQAERLRVSLVLDDSVLARDPDGVRVVAEQKMAARLIDMGHPLGLELSHEDVETQWFREDSKPWEVQGRMAWRPSTRTVELKGGFHDGQRFTVREVGEALRVPVVASTPWLGDDVEATGALTELVETYELAGWREAERVWLYEVK